MKLNCWEYNKCGREPGGGNVEHLGICPVTTQVDYDTAHGGRNAGRVCWIVAGTLCNGRVQGAYAEKIDDCSHCGFMVRVKQEEERSPTGFSYSKMSIERGLESKRSRTAGPHEDSSEAFHSDAPYTFDR